MKLFALYALALLDGMLCGLRSSMGRCALIQKRAYYLRAIGRGVMGAQIISTFALVALLLTVVLSTQRGALLGDLEVVAAHMLRIFVPYAALVLLNLSLRLIPSTDVRSLTSVLMLGPLTAIRLPIMVTGMLYGILASQLLATRILGLFVLALMGTLECTLNWRAAGKQRGQVRKLLEEPGHRLI